MAPGSVFGAAGFSASATSRFRRDQRLRKSSSVIVISVAAPRQRLRILAVAFPFEERTLDMVLGNEGRNDLADCCRHRDLLDQIAFALRKSLALCGIGGVRGKVVLWGSFFFLTAKHN